VSIDWFTFGAQIANFLVLVWLLKIVLYRPIVRAMEARERHIVERQREAQQREQQAQAVRSDYQERLERLESEREQREREARAEVERARTELLDAARAEVEHTRRSWQEALAAEQAEYGRELRRRLADGLCQVARAVVGGLAGRDLERQVIASFVERLGRLEPQALERLRSGLAGERTEVTVSTAFAIDDEQRAALRAAVRAALGDGVEVRFERRDDRLCGVALATGAQAIEWSVDDYCEQLAEAIGLDAQGALAVGRTG